MNARRIWVAVLALVLGLGGVVWWGLTGESTDTAASSDPFGPAEEPDEREDTDATVPDADLVTTVPGTEVVSTVVVTTSVPPSTVAPTTVPATTVVVTTSVASTVPGGVDTSSWVRCTATPGGWTLAHPPAWFVYVPTDGSNSCALFAPTDLSGLPIDDAFGTAHVGVGRIDGVTLAAYRADYIDSVAWEAPPVIETIDVAGRPALRYSAVVPAGIVDDSRWGVHEYVVDLSHLATGGVLYVQVALPLGAEHDTAVQIADAMVTTLVLPTA